MKEFIVSCGNTFIRSFVTRHIFEKLMRFDMLRVYYCTNQYTTFEICIYRSSVRLYPELSYTNRSCTKSFKLLSCAIRATNNCLLPIDNRGRLIRLCSSNDSSQRFPRDIVFSRIQSKCLLHQITLRLLHIDMFLSTRPLTGVTQPSDFV